MPLVVFTTVINADGSSSKVLDGSKLSLCVGAISVLTIVLFIIHFRLTKERIQLPPTQKTSDYNLLKTVKVLAKNKPFVVLCFISMFLICFQMYTQTFYNYLFKNYFEKPGLYSIVTICTYLPMALFLPFMGKLIRKFGKKEICGAGLGFAFVISALMFLLRFTPFAHNPYVFLGLVFLSGAGQTFLVLEVWALVMDVTDYQELLSGRREEGTTYSIYSFVRKLGQTAAGAGVPAVLGAIGYKGTQAVQSQQVLTKMFDAATIVPSVILLLMFILTTFCYQLGKSEIENLHKQLYGNKND